MNQSHTSDLLNSLKQEFPKTCFLIPKIAREDQYSLTYSPAVQARNPSLILDHLGIEQLQETMPKIGLKNLAQIKSSLRDEAGSSHPEICHRERLITRHDKGVYIGPDVLGSTTVFFRNEQEKQEAKNALANRYEFIDDFPVSVLTQTQEALTDSSNPENPSDIRLRLLEESGIPTAHRNKIKGEGVLVGVLDTGIDADHQEFCDKSICYSYIPLNPTDSSPRNVRGFDTGGHGTSICGVIAGKTLGIAPEADLYVASVIESETHTTTYLRIRKSLQWLMEHFKSDNNKNKPAVVNLSICLPSSPTPPDIPKQEILELYLKILRYDLYQMIQANVIVIAAVGNNPDNFTYPGGFQEVLAIGAVDYQHQLADCSGSGCVKDEEGQEYSKPDLMGYGVDVYSSVERDYQGQSTYKGQSGTSIASSYVAGIAALYRCQNPTLSVDAVKTQILTNVIGLPHISEAKSGKGLARFVLQ
ncbi:S8/S53 family peptidase [Gloeothece verrucosa]|uniref:Peptidase S8 and S53 subtilisin kexin sedolisin n=1 Tax=Gloeothece verrucosa (strain PCC 7822) TaxID=497965 RepID=E0UFK0_GLOV7|nr:S8/S53 family peptidase [Gloeothece verrucosa]ADN16694.1 peptidase S8 and S53 subtilisin kexin sedolisin [Gloeothece verrucosa PCC 7822]